MGWTMHVALATGQMARTPTLWHRGAVLRRCGMPRMFARFVLRLQRQTLLVRNARQDLDG